MPTVIVFVSMVELARRSSLGVISFIACVLKILILIFGLGNIARFLLLVFVMRMSFLILLEESGSVREGVLASMMKSKCAVNGER